MQNIQLSENITSYIKDVFSETFLKNYIDYHQSEYNPYLRISSFVDEQNMLSRLANYGIQLEKIENVPLAYRVLSGTQMIGKTLEFALGKYYIQSLSSMIPPHVLKPTENDKVLDLAAAPGSKTTQLAEVMNNRGTLYANEPNVNRIKGLVFNLDKLNFVNIGVIKFKGELLSKVFENYFDKILVDAPCSALGIVQKKGEVSNWWNTNQVDKIANLQLRMLISAIKMAKVGAEIVYSTCTMTVEENEFIINKVLQNYPVELEVIELPVKSHEGFTSYNGNQFSSELNKTRRIIPWEINSEGFFVAKLRKIDSTIANRKAEIKPRDREMISARSKKIEKYLFGLCDHYGIEFEYFQEHQYLFRGNDIFFLHKSWEADDLSVFHRIGTPFGLVDKNDTAHFHSLGARYFAPHITKNKIDLDDTDDLKNYLTGGTIKRSFDGEGQKLIESRGFAFGTAISFPDGLKSQFPRNMRTGEIII
ncbi:MAG: RsmB/NOP family class I SAM-dependent RNA methyltransferase [Melioribacteraceae bacterium]|nr:MAG: RsmB/NOP family class I SAM-dependent RNA methyltransferase [Melioribacteraceae bacterium]